MNSPRVSVIVPIFNGAELVQECQAALSPVLDRLEGGAEVIYVDDGSTDDSIEVLRRVQAIDPRVRIVELAANFGQHAAFTAGFEHARGQFLVTMDVDLQCDPADIPRIIEPLTRGFDLVSGVRLDRQDPGARRLFSRATTSIVSRLAGVELRDIGCPLNAFTDDVARSLAPFGELRRFLKPIAVRVARRVTEVEVQHRARPKRRASSYSATGLVRLFMDFFVNAIGDVFACVFVISAALAVLLLAGGTLLVVLGLLPGITGAVTVIGVWVFILGIQATLLALFGLAGDYIQRIYRQSSGRPFYLVRRMHDGAGR
jgi:undecaprenyl-phosphate 4-deoxy-4-formamido-L-arabinose transferase